MSFTTALRCPTCTAPSGESAKCPCRGISPRFSPFTAAELGDLTTVIKFVEKQGRDVNKEDSGGYTMLHYAAQHNRTEVVEYLCKKNATLNADTCGATPLHRAAYAGSIDCVKFLVSAGADVFQRDISSFGKSRTALHKAADQGHSHIVEFFLQTNEGLTALLDADGNSYRDLLRNKAAASHIVTSSNYVNVDIGGFVQKTSSSNGDKVNVKDKQLQNFGVLCPGCGIKTLTLVRRHCCKSLTCKACHKSSCNGCS